MTTVAIIGAGVSGLTCGVALAKAGFDVTLFASEIERTTSSVAAAIWYPYDISHPDAGKWSLESYATFRELANDPATGVSMVPFHVHGEPLPAWGETMEPRLIEGGYVITVPLIETPIYLPWLREQVRIERRTIASFDELTGTFDLVVNCAGLGARELCNDADLHPGRGVVLRAPYSGPRVCMADVGHATGLTYILTRRHDVILGGTNDARDDDDVPTELADAIYARCLEVEPSLRKDFVADVGFRPLRSVVRLEREARVIHNYGHGGAGFTVSWGCARDVLRLAGSAP